MRDILTYDPSADPRENDKKQRLKVFFDEGTRQWQEAQKKAQKRRAIEEAEHAQAGAELERQILNGELNFADVSQQLLATSDFNRRMLILEKISLFHSREAADFLLDQWQRPAPKEFEDRTPLWYYDRKFSLDIEAVSSEASVYQDAIVHVLGNNGSASEEALWIIFKQFDEIQKKAVEDGKYYERMDGSRNEEDDFAIGPEHEQVYMDEESDLVDREYKNLFDSTYYEKEAVLDYLSQLGTDDTVLKMIDLVKKGYVEFFKKEIAQGLNNINPNLAAQELLPLLKAKNQNIKTDAAKLLYRLEFGRIGISEEGVQYLERMYDLGEYNNPAYFVNRLTAEGDIGIFDEKRELLKYFNLGHLSADKKKIRAQVLDFTYETLFTPKPDETGEERTRREKVLEEFQSKYFDFYNDKFFQETKVHFNNLSFQEQGWFLHFYENADETKKERTMEFVKTYGEAGFRTFLSLDYGDDLGDQILKIGEESDPQAGRAIFEKYGEIIDQIKDVSIYLRAQFSGQQNFDETSINRIAENLLQKGKDLLVRFSETRETDPREVLKDLNLVKTEVLLFASTFKVASEEKPLDFSEIQGVEINIKDSSELTEEDKKQMRQIYKGNRAKYEAKRLAETVQEFEEVLASKGKEFNLLVHNGELLAFIRFDRLPNGNLYAGSLNVRPEARNSQIGMALLRATLDKKAETHNIEALAHHKLPMLKHYVEDFGFQIVGELPNYHGSEMYYQLFRPRAEERRQPAAA